MTSFEFDIGEKERVGVEFISRVVSELKRALSYEKGVRKLTQQSIAEKIGTSRAVINRQVQGLENLSLRRVAELFWAIGWEPHFEARKIPAGENLFTEIPQPTSRGASETTERNLDDDQSSAPKPTFKMLPRAA
jgi:hypothetical protein